MNNRNVDSAVLVAWFSAPCRYGFARLSPAADTQMSRSPKAEKVALARWMVWREIDKRKSPFADMQSCLLCGRGR